MQTQEIFYILGSVFFGLFILIFLMVIALISRIRFAVIKLEKIGEEIGDEVMDSIKKVKKYAEYASGFGLTSIIAKLFKAGVKARSEKNRRNKSDEEDEDERE